MLSKPYVKPLPWRPVSIHATPAKGTVDATSSISHVLMYLDAPPQRKNSQSDSVPIPQLFNLTIKSFSMLLGGVWREWLLTGMQFSSDHQPSQTFSCQDMQQKTWVWYQSRRRHLLCNQQPEGHRVDSV